MLLCFVQSFLNTTVNVYTSDSIRRYTSWVFWQTLPKCFGRHYPSVLANITCQSVLTDITWVFWHSWPALQGSLVRDPGGTGWGLHTSCIPRSYTVVLPEYIPRGHAQYWGLSVETLSWFPCGSQLYKKLRQTITLQSEGLSTVLYHMTKLADFIAQGTWFLQYL